MQPKNHITTFKKHRFSPLSPSAEDIDIRDIAHALSLICRANGHFARFYSVGQHSLNCAVEAGARKLSREIQLAALLHDASEAYLSDITRPVKIELPEYRAIELKLQLFIYKIFDVDLNLDGEIFRQVEEIDTAMLYAEFSELMNERVSEKEQFLKTTPDLRERAFLDVEKEFLNLFFELKLN